MRKHKIESKILAIVVGEFFIEEFTLLQEFLLPEHQIERCTLDYHSLMLLTFLIIWLTYLSLILELAEISGLTCFLVCTHVCVVWICMFWKSMCYIDTITASPHSSTIFHDIRKILLVLYWYYSTFCGLVYHESTLGKASASFCQSQISEAVSEDQSLTIHRVKATLGCLQATSKLDFLWHKLYYYLFSLLFYPSLLCP